MPRLTNRRAVALAISAVLAEVGAILSRDSTSVVSVREAVVSAASSRISLEVEDAALAAMLVVVSLDSLASEAVLVVECGTGGCGGCGGQGTRQSNGEMNMNVNLDMYTALLGGEGIVKLSNGTKIKLKIKPETQNGTKVRVRGKGYDRGDGTFGDLIITYNVKLPTGLNEKQKELLKQMKEAN